MKSCSFGPLAVLLTWSALFLVGLSAQRLVPMTKADKQAVLDTHNELRARTARGETPGQPSAVDMMLLEWDDRLMDKAATWAMKCVPGHDTAADRAIPGYTFVGQNWAGGHTENMSLFVDSWYQEFKDFTYDGKEGSCTPGKMCGHYTQVVWSRSLLVGCASSVCADFPRTLVCNYAQAGNVAGLPPYERGAAASKCIAEYVYGRDGLCLRKDQCQGKDCSCAIACDNGGTLDSANCKCNCPLGFYGSRCEVTCSDPDLWRPQCESDPDACKTFAFFCPKTCKQCVYGDIADKTAVNPDGVVGRVPPKSKR